MKTSMQAIALEIYVPALRTLSGLLDKGAEHAQANGIDLAALLNEKLAPDMFPLTLQVQLACHHAKDGTARVTGQEPPKIENKETDLCRAQSAHRADGGNSGRPDAKAFDGAEDRRVELPLQGQRQFESDGFQFLSHWSIPHFYFHVVTAYDILRHNGVALGKRDYMKDISGGFIRQLAPA